DLAASVSDELIDRRHEFYVDAPKWPANPEPRGGEGYGGPLPCQVRSGSIFGMLGPICGSVSGIRSELQGKPRRLELEAHPLGDRRELARPLLDVDGDEAHLRVDDSDDVEKGEQPCAA